METTHKSILVSAEKIIAAKKAIAMQSNLLELLNSYELPNNTVALSAKAYLKGMQQIMEMLGLETEGGVATGSGSNRFEIIEIRRTY